MNKDNSSVIFKVSTKEVRPLYPELLQYSHPEVTYLSFISSNFLHLEQNLRTNL